MMRPLSLAVAVVALSAIGCSDAPARPAKLGLYMMIRNPSDPDEWTFRVRSTTEGILSAWEATRRWEGELTIPVAELAGRMPRR